MGAYYSIKDNGMLSDKDGEVFVLRCSTRWLWCMKKAGFGARTAGQRWARSGWEQELSALSNQTRLSP
jgi:hypothetical protein